MLEFDVGVVEGTQTTVDEELWGGTFFVNPHEQSTLAQGRRHHVGGCCCFKWMRQFYPNLKPHLECFGILLHPVSAATE